MTNIARLAIAIVVLYFVLWGLAMLFYEIVFAQQLTAFEQVMRSDEAMGETLPWMLVGYLIQVTLFCYIFTRAYEGRGIGEGVRYGLLAGGLIAAVEWTYSLALPVPIGAATLSAVLSLVMWVVAGTLLALIYKPRQEAGAAGAA